MNPKNAVPLVAAAAPVALAMPPVLILAALGLGALWLLSREDKAAPQLAPAAMPPAKPANAPESKPGPLRAPAQGVPLPLPARKPSAQVRRITREDLAEALAYGERQFTRKEAVAALEALGFRKSSAYKAFSEEGKFANLLGFTPDGLIDWRA